MTDVTLGLIYALKHRDKSYDEAVIDFYSKLSGTAPLNIMGKKPL